MKEIENLRELVNSYRNGERDTELRFGKHYGKNIEEVPHEYLVWASRETNIPLTAPARPAPKPTQVTGDLQALFAELERQKQNRYDLVVPTESLIVLQEENQILMDVPQPDDKVKRHGITEFAQHQIAEKCKIPWRYYDKMREAGKLDLLTDNVNAWLPDKEQRLVRVLDDNVRALLSDRYRCIDNYDMSLLMLEEFEKIQKGGMQVDIKDATLTETKLYIKATSPDLSDDVIYAKGKAEPVHGGIIISNSEVGHGAFRVEPFMNVLVCQNGLISDRAFARVHLGRQLDAGFIDWSNETIELDDKALWAKIRDMIRGTFTKEIFQSWVDRLNEVASFEIPKPVVAVDNVVKHFKISDKRKEDLLNQFAKQSPTQWGLSMAVTRIAQDEKNYDNRIELEKVGAKILETQPQILIKEQK